MTQTLEPDTTTREQTDDVAPQVVQWSVQWLDPATLLVDHNARTVADLDADFLDSLREFGIIQPIIAVQSTEGVRVRFGQRRTLGAIKVQMPLVPVVIFGDERTDDAAQIERLCTQWDENERRKGLRDSDKIETARQLSAFGVTAAQIKKRTKWSKEQVRTALSVGASELASRAAARYDLTLDQAAVVQDFQDDTDTVKALIAAVRTGQFEHVAQRARDERDREQQRIAQENARQESQAPIRAELAAAAVTVLDTDALVAPAKRLSTLTNDRATNQALTPEQHASCPGHAVYLHETWVWVQDAPTESDQQPEDSPPSESDSRTGAEAHDTDEEIQDEEDDEYEYDEDEDEGGHQERVWRPVFVCTDPSQYGHDAVSILRNSDTTKTMPAAVEDPATAAARTAKRRETVENNRAWASAKTVREEWVQGFVKARKKAPTGTGVFLASALARHGDTIASTGGNHLAAKMFGLSTTGIFGRSTDLSGLIETANDARAQVIHLGVILAAYEKATDREDWRTIQDRTAFYLTHLEAIGYHLSPVEQLACGRTPQVETDTAPDADTDPDADSAIE